MYEDLSHPRTLRHEYGIAASAVAAFAIHFAVGLWPGRDSSWPYLVAYSSLLMLPSRTTVSGPVIQGLLPLVRGYVSGHLPSSRLVFGLSCQYVLNFYTEI